MYQPDQQPDYQPNYQQGNQQPFQDYSQQYYQQYDQQYYQQADQLPEEPAPEKKGKSKKLIAVGIVLLLLGALTCVYLMLPDDDDNGDQKESPMYESLIIDTAGEPRELDPATNYETMGTNLIYNVYQTLIGYDGVSVTEFVPLLATEVPTMSNGLVSSDGLNYTFNIRQGVTFHDGSTLDADDVTYSFKRVLRMRQSPSWMMDEVLNESDIVKVGEFTVQLTLERPCAHFLHLMSHTISSIVSMETVETHGGIDDDDQNDWMNENMVGTGPYELVSWSQDSGDVKLEAYDGYWGSTPSIKTIDILNVEDLTTRIVHLQLGYTDVAYIPTSSLEEVEGKYDVVVEEGPLRMAGYYIALNCQKEPLDDVRVRQAVSYCFDYDAMLDEIYKGYGARYVGPWLHGMEEYDDSLQPYEQDVETAKDLLEDAGYPTDVDDQGHIEITLMYTTSEISSLLAQLFRSNCDDIGIDVTLQLLDWPTLLQKTDSGDFDCTLLGFLADFPHPYGMQTIVDGELCGYTNNAWYQNSNVDSWIDNASKTIDDEDRLDLYHQIQQQVRDDCPYIWTVQPRTMKVVRDRVQNYAGSTNPHLGTYYADVWKTD